MVRHRNPIFLASKYLFQDLSVRLEEPAKREIIKLLELQKKDKESRNEYFDGQLHIWNWRYYGFNSFFKN